MEDKEDKESSQATPVDKDATSKPKMKIPIKAKEFLKPKGSSNNPSTAPKIKIIKKITIPPVAKATDEDTIIISQKRRNLSPTQIDAKPCYTINSNSKKNKQLIRSSTFQSEHAETSQGETILTSLISPARLLKKRIS